MALPSVTRWFNSHAFVAALLLVAIGVAAAWWLTPFFAFVFGTGLLPWLIPALLLFGVLLLLRRLFFREIYYEGATEGDAALLEYWQTNHAEQTPAESISTELLENALHLKQVRAADCMTPLEAMVYLDVSAPVRALRELFISSKRSRIVIVDGEPGRVVGYVHVQQLFDDPQDLRSLVMPMTFVAADLPVDHLLPQLIRRRNSIVCLTDAAGEVIGLVTLDDALSELFGNIADEYEPLPDEGG
jgi:CBS domain containing-hemolysin-like protein